jgi:hypothetical protein
MAKVAVLLQGGPCDGKTVQDDAAAFAEGQFITCQGSLYQPVIGTSSPRIADVVPKTIPGGGSSIAAPRAHKGWHDMRRSVNHRWPHALAASDRQIRAALRSLGKAHKVRL